MDINYSKLCRIREIVNCYDPEEWGAPPDEYYDLIDKMISEIENPQKDCIKNVVYAHFEHLLEVDGSKQNFEEKLDRMVNEISDCLM